MNSPSLNLSPTPVKAYLLLIKLLCPVLILASNLQHTTSHALLTTLFLSKTNLLLRLVRQVSLARMVYLFLAVILSLTSVHLLRLKVPSCPSRFRCPVLCHELTLSTIYKITCYARASSPRIPSLLNISFGLRSATMAIKATIFTIVVDFLKKITRVDIPHVTWSPILTRFPPMKMIGWQGKRFEVLATASNCLALIHLQTQLLNTNLKATAWVSGIHAK